MAKKRPLMKSPPTETVYATYNAAETAARRAAPCVRHANISDKATVPSVIGSWLMLFSTYAAPWRIIRKRGMPVATFA